WIMGLSVWVLWVWIGWEKHLNAAQKQMRDTLLLVQEQHQDIERLQKSRKEADTLRLCQIQSAADQFPHAALLLDQHQRVIVFNKRAQLLLEKAGGPKGWIGCSWQDIPFLNQQGEALQHSMESPGQSIVTQSHNSKIRLFSQTAPDRLGTLTWVYPE